ncbi:hypothetical protein PV403_21920 [Paenibacillus sp. GYB006]|uniref:hypothetical protein n=1 Tax=Paenibacillus sp. GYB006 TaxID=2994394 RepID=UPI002F96ACCA
MHTLGNLLDSFIDESVFKLNGVQIVNQYPNLVDIVANYKNELASADNSQPYLLNSHHMFEETMYFPHCNGEYTVTWDINRARHLINQMIQNRRLIANEVSVEEVYPYIQKNEITESYLPNALKSNEPIILVWYSPTSQKLIIDGNHRVAARYRQDPKTKIQVYGPFSHYAHIDFMSNDLNRKLFVIHHNMQMIFNYMKGDMTKRELFSGEIGLFNGTEDLNWMKGYFTPLLMNH